MASDGIDRTMRDEARRLIRKRLGRTLLPHENRCLNNIRGLIALEQILDIARFGTREEVLELLPDKGEMPEA